MKPANTDEHTSSQHLQQPNHDARKAQPVASPQTDSESARYQPGGDLYVPSFVNTDMQKTLHCK